MPDVEGMDEAGLRRELRDLAVELVGRSREAGLRVACAESCTAGMVASAIGGIPGASEVLMGGVVSYTEDVKHRVLGVSLSTLETFTAVSEPCAREMAEGALRLLSSDAAVSVTGYAGPGGGTEEEPVGTVYLGLARRGLPTRVVRASFPGGRNLVRLAAAAEALRLLLSCVGIR